MTNSSNNKKTYDLEGRTTEFAKRVIRLCRSVPKDSINNRITGQLTGCAGSVGANYREANDALGRKDFFSRMRIARKEAKETIHWLECLKEATDESFYKEIDVCIQEATELRNILSAIIKKDI